MTVSAQEADPTVYHDSEGRPCDLAAVCRREPAWAASRIGQMKEDTEKLRRRVAEAVHHRLTRKAGA